MSVYGVKNKRDRRWINYCLRKSYSHKVNNSYRHVACLVQGGRIIRTGTNKAKAGCLKDKIYEYRQHHAELDTLCSLNPKDVKGGILYVAGWTKGDNIVKSKPCRHCMEYLQKFDLKKIVYSMPNGDFEELVL